MQPSLLDEARKVAEAEGVALNQLINVVLAEKLSALRTASYFAERAARAIIPRRSAFSTALVSVSRPSKATNCPMQRQRGGTAEVNRPRNTVTAE